MSEGPIYEAVTVEGIEIKIAEIANLMCAVADDNSWKRGRRDFMVTSRNLYGMQFDLRHKDWTIKLVNPAWRCIVHYGVETGGSGYRFPKAKLPVITRAVEVKPITNRWTRQATTKAEPKTTIRLFDIRLPVFEIESVEAFHRDWTLIRLFGSEWDHYQ